MTNFNFQFNASQIDPATGGGTLPVGRYQTIISDIEVTGTKDNNNGALKITHKVTHGEYAGQTMRDQLNMWHQNAQTSEIAARALSAISHVTGVMQFNNLDELQKLKGIPMGIDVGLQKQPANLPEGMTPEAWKAKGYTEVKGYFDRDGNPPKKGQPVNGGAQTGGQGPGAGFGGGNNNQPPANNNQPANTGTGAAWGNNNNAPPQNEQPNQGGNAGGGWGNQGGNNNSNQGGGNAGGGNWGGGNQPPNNQNTNQPGNTAGGWGGGNAGGGGGSWPGNNA